ncbi:MAG: histidine triad nucleotide-binding protein [Acidobacteria bacterium]|nr:histidine triad nucleotide-binding protein [Acidobacteriota bacterium]MBV9475638.1 histidine triad nucleotide-binding protein [Acidobacteriota bacterium]
MPSNADLCLFCRIASGAIPAKKVHEDADVVAFHDINPQAPTHVLVIPRKHISALDELTDADAATIGTTIVRATEIARELHLEQEGYRVVINNGEGAGQTVFHIHVHVLGGRAFTWPPG